MIDFHKHTLNNGLTLIVHIDRDTPVVAVNTLYKVGARDEDPNRTGFAHLFEHLMFSGSKNAPSFDIAVQEAGGVNNAFTNNDFTNYYISLPVQNLERALWLEADRMRSLNISESSLSVQKNVVVEEFKQRYLNQPYGDVWLHLRPMIYKQHPYQWPTIGKSIEHIGEAILDDVVQFYNRYYQPSNAILVVAGNVDLEQTILKVEHWFGNLPNHFVERREHPNEQRAKVPERKLIKAEVPNRALYLAWPMEGRLAKNYYSADLISDILGNGNSSVFYKNLVKKKQIVNSISCFISGSLDPGMLVTSAMLADGVSFERAMDEILGCIQNLKSEGIDPQIVQKVKNKFEASHLFAQTTVLNKAMNLAYYEFIGMIEEVNSVVDKYLNVDENEILQTLSEVFVDEERRELLYDINDKG